MAPAALVLLISTIGLFRRSGTRPEPWLPTTAIVDTGVYRLTRNPMYLGMTLAYVGIASTSGLAPLILPPIVVLILHFGVVRRQERYLDSRFGAEYIAYKARVRRWI